MAKKDLTQILAELKSLVGEELKVPATLFAFTFCTEVFMKTESIAGHACSVSPTNGFPGSTMCRQMLPSKYYSTLPRVTEEKLT